MLISKYALLCEEANRDVARLSKYMFVCKHVYIHIYILDNERVYTQQQMASSRAATVVLLGTFVCVYMYIYIHYRIYVCVYRDSNGDIARCSRLAAWFVRVCVCMYIDVHISCNVRVYASIGNGNIAQRSCLDVQYKCVCIYV